jgi:hypothetical protein
MSVMVRSSLGTALLKMFFRLLSSSGSPDGVAGESEFIELATETGLDLVDPMECSAADSRPPEAFCLGRAPMVGYPAVDTMAVSAEV